MESECRYISLEVKGHGQSLDVRHCVCCEWYKNAAAVAPHMAGDRHGDSLCRSNILRSCNAKKTAVKCLFMSRGREGYEKMHLAYDFEAVSDKPMALV